MRSLSAKDERNDEVGVQVECQMHTSAAAIELGLKLLPSTLDTSLITTDYANHIVRTAVSRCRRVRGGTSSGIRCRSTSAFLANHEEMGL